MNSEKVKEIKKALEDNANYKHHNKLGYIDGYKCKTVAFADILTLINELESENERLKILVDIANERTYRKKFIEEWRKEYQKELDKQGEGHIAGFPDFDLVYKLYFEQKDRIAELEDKIENGTLVEFPFCVFDKKKNKEADCYKIALKEDWAKCLCYCDMDGFAITQDGMLILLDECGRYTYCPDNRFKVVAESELKELQEKQK